MAAISAGQAACQSTCAVTRAGDRPGDKAQAYQLPRGASTRSGRRERQPGLPWTGRTTGAACDGLVDLGVRRGVVRWQNSPDRSGRRDTRLSVERAAQVPRQPPQRRYLEAKRDRLGHRLHQLA
ncbi:hypothetical protein HBB16_08920 [Pseudonocardia sp. MCCB 268]|nr:hypothetical protein [Pseudonocardia cytotoxica]